MQDKDKPLNGSQPQDEIKGKVQEDEFNKTVSLIRQSKTRTADANNCNFCRLLESRWRSRESDLLKENSQLQDKARNLELRAIEQQELVASYTSTVKDLQLRSSACEVELQQQVHQQEFHWKRDEQNIQKLSLEVEAERSRADLLEEKAQFQLDVCRSREETLARQETELAERVVLMANEQYSRDDLINEMLAELGYARRQVFLLGAKLSDASTELKSTQLEVRNLTSQMNRQQLIQQELEGIKNTQEAEIRRLTEQSLVQGSFRDEQDRVRQEQITVVQEEIRGLMVDCDYKSACVQSQKTEHKETLQELKSSQLQVAELQASLNALRNASSSERISLSAELQVYKSALETAQQSLRVEASKSSSIEIEIESKLAEVEANTAEITRLKTKLQHETDNKSEQLCAKAAAITKLERRLHEMEAKMASATSGAEEAMAEAISARAAKEAAEERLRVAKEAAEERLRVEKEAAEERLRVEKFKSEKEAAEERLKSEKEAAEERLKSVKEAGDERQKRLQKELLQTEERLNLEIVHLQQTLNTRLLESSESTGALEAQVRSLRDLLHSEKRRSEEAVQAQNALEREHLYKMEEMQHKIVMLEQQLQNNLVMQDELQSRCLEREHLHKTEEMHHEREHLYKTEEMQHKIVMLEQQVQNSLSMQDELQSRWKEREMALLTNQDELQSRWKEREIQLLKEIASIKEQMRPPSPPSSDMVVKSKPQEDAKAPLTSLLLLTTARSAELANLQHELKSKTAEVGLKSAEIDRLEHELDLKLAEIAHLQSEIARLQRELETQQDMPQQSLGTSSLEAQFLSLQDSLNTEKRLSEQLVLKTEEMQQKITMLEQQLQTNLSMQDELQSRWKEREMELLREMELVKEMHALQASNEGKETSPKPPPPHLSSYLSPAISTSNHSDDESKLQIVPYSLQTSSREGAIKSTVSQLLERTTPPDGTLDQHPSPSALDITAANNTTTIERPAQEPMAHPEKNVEKNPFGLKVGKRSVATASKGLEICAVLKDGPADVMGIKPGQYLRSIGNVKIQDRHTFKKQLDLYHSVDFVSITVTDSSSQDVSVILPIHLSSGKISQDGWIFMVRRRRSSVMSSNASSPNGASRHRRRGSLPSWTAKQSPDASLPASSTSPPLSKLGLRRKTWSSGASDIRSTEVQA